MIAPVTERRRRGDSHPSGDGRMFFTYQKDGSNERERWVTQDRLEEKRKKAKGYCAHYYAVNPEKAEEKQARR